MVYRPSLGFAPKLAATIVIALLAGFAWAWIERKGLRFDSPGSSTPAKPEPKKDGKDAGDPGRKEAPVTKTDPTKNTERKRDGETAVTISESRLASILKTVEIQIAAGKYLEAWNALSEVKDIQVGSDESRARLRATRERVQTYLRLIRETRLGATIRMPEITRLHTPHRTKVVVRRLTEDSAKYHFEDLGGGRWSVSKSDVARTEKLDPFEAFVEIWEALVPRAARAGIVAVEEKKNGVYVHRFEEAPNRKPAGWQFFDLADFCASNGANELLTPLFDEALKRDPEIVRTVHEKKGDRMVEVLFYFLSIQSIPDAEFTLTKVLLPLYSDTRAYRDRVLADEDARKLIAQVLKTEVKFTPPDKPRDETPESTTKRDEPPVRVTEPKTSTTGFAPMPGDTTSAVRARVEEGDRAFKSATDHLLLSDPNANPEGWAAENKKAYELYKQAAGAYEAAQGLYGSATVPQPLLDRFRDAQMRMSLCRKRAVSGR